jgi:CopA family copper-resistance protein
MKNEIVTIDKVLISLKAITCLSILMLNLFYQPNAFGANRTVDLVVSNKVVNFSEKSSEALAINDKIPAPTLHFKQGDHVTINVCNHLDEGTTIHWHGILVPWQMDGVEGVSQKAISPGESFQYKFTLYQSGTYWYHAHANSQEQEGLYGAFIIDPLEPPHYNYNKDYEVVLSDWSNTHAEKILANLKKEGDYYSPKFPLQPSLMKFIHDYRKATSEESKLLIDDYKMMQQMRMSIYDLSDVAYDAYLLNGQTKTCPWNASVKVGDVVRLRFIGAVGSTIYRVKIPGTKMEMIHVQGNDVRSNTMSDFSIAPGETIDVLVKIEKNMPYIIYAESIDTRGVAVGALITNSNQKIDYKQVTPFSEPKPVTRGMMSKMTPSSHSMKMNSEMPNHDMKSMSTETIENHSSQIIHSSHSKKPESSSAPVKHNMEMSSGKNYELMKMGGDMKMSSGVHMNHSMEMPIEPAIIGDTISTSSSFSKNPKKSSTPQGKTIDHQGISSGGKTMGTKYQDLIAAVKTNDPNKPVNGTIKMELFGYMERFIWMINGLPEYKAKPIVIEPGKRYRIIFTNNSMMRHPMHIHGHWFILRNGHGKYDPLLHTIEVPPGATAVADIDADASGQWFFHCHHLYHMMTGMSRVFQYNTIVEVAKGEIKPQKQVLEEPFVNRPILRVDEQIPIDTSLIHHPMAHPKGIYQASFLDIGAGPFHNVQKWTFKGLYGGDYNKLELFSEDAEIKKGKIKEADIDILYWRLISQFWAIKGGVNYFYRPAKTPYWQPSVGIEGLMPYFIETNVRAYLHNNTAKLDIILSRDSQIANNFFIKAGIRSILASKTVIKNEVGSGLNQIRYIIRPFYRLAPNVFLFAEYEHTQTYGALKNIRRKAIESVKEDTLTFGMSFIF